MNTRTYLAMREMWARGLTVDEIAEAVGMTRHAAFAMMKRDRAAFPHRRHHADWWRARLAEWTYGDGTVSYASDGRWFHAWAYNDDTMCVSMGYLTPAQAVEATLGSDLQAENDKLRELVRIMHGELVSCEDNGYVCGGHKFDERVRELGIEVDA